MSISLEPTLVWNRSLVGDHLDRVVRRRGWHPIAGLPLWPKSRVAARKPWARAGRIRQAINTAETPLYDPSLPGGLSYGAQCFRVTMEDMSIYRDNRFVHPGGDSGPSDDITGDHLDRHRSIIGFRQLLALGREMLSSEDAVVGVHLRGHFVSFEGAGLRPGAYRSDARFQGVVRRYLLMGDHIDFEISRSTCRSGAERHHPGNLRGSHDGNTSQWPERHPIS